MYIGKALATEAIDMSRFDVTNATMIANQHLKTLDNPRQRKILINFRDHALAEYLGDHEALMATCSQRHQRYEIHGSDLELDHMQPDNYEDLFHYYKALIDLNVYIIHTEIEKLIVGQDALMLDAVVHQVLNGEQIQDFFGLEGADCNTVYQTWSRAGIMFIFDADGMGCGEHSFADGGMTLARIRPIPENLIPTQFYDDPGTVSDYLAAHPELDWPTT